LVGARDAARRAVQLDPTNIEARTRLGWVLLELAVSADDYSEVATEARKTLTLDPGFPTTYRVLTRAAYADGDFARAVALADSARLMGLPSIPSFFEERGRARAAGGSSVAVLADADSALSLGPSNTDIAAHLRALGGDHGGAKQLLPRVAQRPNIYVAMMLATLGDNAAAVSELESVFEGRFDQGSYQLIRDRIFDKLKTQPRYLSLAARADSIVRR
jgi:hypothetical protein